MKKILVKKQMTSWEIFFQPRTGLKSRAFLEDELRYIILQNGEGVEILEEDGEWDSGELEVWNENDYKLIYEENGNTRTEEMEAEEARSYLH